MYNMAPIQIFSPAFGNFSQFYFKQMSWVYSTYTTLLEIQNAQVLHISKFSCNFHYY